MVEVTETNVLAGEFWSLELVLETESEDKIVEERLTWDKLLSEKRKRMSSAGNSINSARNEFEADYDRIVGSSSVRRLQDKAQVFPL